MGKEREILGELIVPLATLGLLAVALCGFSKDQRNQLKNQRTDINDKSKLEIHHINPVYRGGESTLDNGEAVTRPEHAYEHWKEAMNSCNREDRDANYWAVKKIIQRMTPEELKEFNKMISRRR